MRIQITQLVQALQTLLQRHYSEGHMLIETESCGHRNEDQAAYERLNAETWEFIDEVRRTSGVHLDTAFIVPVEESIRRYYND